MAYDPLDFLKASTTKRFMNFVYGGDDNQYHQDTAVVCKKFV
jgi:hypothetical protein